MGRREGRRKMGPQGLEAQMTVPVRLVRYRNTSGMKHAGGRTEGEATGVRRASWTVSFLSAKIKGVPQT